MYDYRLLRNNRNTNENSQVNNPSHQENFNVNNNQPNNYTTQIMPNQSVSYQNSLYVNGGNNFTQGDLNYEFSHLNAQSQNFPNISNMSNIQSPVYLDSNLNYDSYFFSQCTPSLNSFIDEEYRQKQLLVHCRETYDINTKPVLKLSQYKLNSLTNEIEIDQIYFLTPFGLKGSRRDVMEPELKFGRMELDENGNVSNDIFIGDRTVSRFHCKINYQDGFKQIKPLNEEMLSLFMMNHYRLGRNLNVPNLDQGSIYNICTYLTKKRQFLLSDSGSILGTYIRLRKNQVCDINDGQIFSIGNEFYFIINVCNFADSESLFSNLVGEQSSGTAIRAGEEFKKENLSDNYFLSYLKIVINPAGSDLNLKIILLPSQNKCNFIIGRNNLNDIFLNNSTISREHTGISYSPSENKWNIWDGSKTKESLNGTWLSITNINERLNRQESRPFPISDGDEIKISEFLFRVEELNIEKYYNN